MAENDINPVLEKLKSRFGERMWQYTPFRKGVNHRVAVEAEQLYPFVEFLKNECGFDLLVDVTCVDYLHYRKARDRFGLVYVLVATDANLQLIVRCYLNEPDLKVASVVPLWLGADWFEREVYDMFGIEFVGHPDLRRILLPTEFESFPLRKDYPLRGRGERHNFERITRDQS
jgi:NADH-quinone oxidoreductase subunit C